MTILIWKRFFSRLACALGARAAHDDTTPISRDMLPIDLAGTRAPTQ